MEDVEGDLTTDIEDVEETGEKGADNEIWGEAGQKNGGEPCVEGLVRESVVKIIKGRIGVDLNHKESFIVWNHFQKTNKIPGN